MHRWHGPRRAARRLAVELDALPGYGLVEDGLRVGQVSGGVGEDQAGGNNVGGRAATAGFGGEGVCEGSHGALGRRVGGWAGLGMRGGDRSYGVLVNLLGCISGCRGVVFSVHVICERASVLSVGQEGC